MSVAVCSGQSETAPAPAGAATPREPVVPTPPGLQLDRVLGAPSPVEYFLSLAKSTNPRWRRSYRELAPQPPTDRTKVAAGLGMLATDAHLAAMARDGQRARNVSAELNAFAKILGLSETAAPRVAAFEAASGGGDWAPAHLELEELVISLAGKLREQRDDDLALLLEIGLWVRTVHVGAGVVGAGEVEDLTMASGGAGIPGWIATRAASLSERCRADPDIAYVLRQGEKIVRIWAPEKIAAGKVYTLEEVTDTRDRLDGIINRLSKR